MLGLGLGINKDINRKVGGVEIGSYIDKDYTTAANLSDHTVSVTTSTIALSGGFLNMVDGDGSFTNFIRVDSQGSRDTVTCLYKWSQTIIVNAVDQVANGGIGIGISKFTGGDRGVVGVLDLSNAGTSGDLRIYASGGTTLVATSSTPLSWSASDSISLTFDQNDDLMTFTAENLTTPDTISVTYTFSFANGGTVHNHRQGYFSIYNMGGEQDVLTNVVTSNQLKNVPYLMIGDSITYGIYSGAADNRFWKHLSRWATLEPWAGGGAQTSEVIAGFDELTLINPTNVVLMIGGNDIAFAVPTGTWQTNLDSIRAHFVSMGANIIWCYNTPRDAVDITPINTYIQTNFSSDTIIAGTFNDYDDGGTGMGSGLNSGDNVHPGGWGHFMLARTIGTALGFTIDTLTEASLTEDANVDITGNSIIKDSGGAGYNAGAYGNVLLDYTNSVIYWGMEGAGSGYAGVGVGWSTIQQATTYLDINQGCSVTTSNKVRPMLNGVLQAALADDLTFGDLIRIEINGTRLIVHQNGVEVYNQPCTISQDMYVVTTLFNLNDEILEILHI